MTQPKSKTIEEESKAETKIASAKGNSFLAAPIQPDIEAEPGHPAVDADPRTKSTPDQNRIDFNDPTLSGSEAVARNLEAQGWKLPEGGE